MATRPTALVPGDVVAGCCVSGSVPAARGANGRRWRPACRGEGTLTDASSAPGDATHRLFRPMRAALEAPVSSLGRSARSAILSCPEVEKRQPRPDNRFHTRGCVDGSASFDETPKRSHQAPRVCRGRFCRACSLAAPGRGSLLCQAWISPIGLAVFSRTSRSGIAHHHSHSRRRQAGLNLDEAAAAFISVLMPLRPRAGQRSHDGGFQRARSLGARGCETPTSLGTVSPP